MGASSPAAAPMSPPSPPPEAAATLSSAARFLGKGMVPAGQTSGQPPLNGSRAGVTSPPLLSDESRIKGQPAGGASSVQDAAAEVLVECASAESSMAGASAVQQAQDGEVQEETKAGARQLQPAAAARSTEAKSSAGQRGGLQGPVAASGAVEAGASRTFSPPGGRGAEGVGNGGVPMGVPRAAVAAARAASTKVGIKAVTLSKN